MRKLKRTLMFALTTLIALSASAFKVTLNVPGDNQVKVEIQTDFGSTTKVLSAGDNELEVEQYNSLDCNGISPYQINGVTDGNGNTDGGYFGGNNGTSRCSGAYVKMRTGEVLKF